MKTKLAFVVVVALLLAADADKEAAVKKDMKGLEGTWVVVSAEQEGQALDRIKGGKLVVESGTFAIHTKSGADLKGDYRIDPAKKPKTMDLTHTEGPLGDKTWQAIYHLDGDELKICYAEADSGKERPTDFATTAGSGFLLTVLKRERP